MEITVSLFSSLNCSVSIATKVIWFTTTPLKKTKQNTTTKTTSMEKKANFYLWMLRLHKDNI